MCSWPIHGFLPSCLASPGACCPPICSRALRLPSPSLRQPQMREARFLCPNTAQPLHLSLLLPLALALRAWGHDILVPGAVPFVVPSAVPSPAPAPAPGSGAGAVCVGRWHASPLNRPFAGRCGKLPKGPEVTIQGRRVSWYL